MVKHAVLSLAHIGGNCWENLERGKEKYSLASLSNNNRDACEPDLLGNRA